MLLSSVLYMNTTLCHLTHVWVLLQPRLGGLLFIMKCGCYCSENNQILKLWQISVNKIQNFSLCINVLVRSSNHHHRKWLIFSWFYVRRVTYYWDVIGNVCAKSFTTNCLVNIKFLCAHLKSDINRLVFDLWHHKLVGSQLWSNIHSHHKCNVKTWSIQYTDTENWLYRRDILSPVIQVVKNVMSYIYDCRS